MFPFDAGGRDAEETLEAFGSRSTPSERRISADGKARSSLRTVFLISAKHSTGRPLRVPSLWHASGVMVSVDRGTHKRRPTTQQNSTRGEKNKRNRWNLGVAQKPIELVAVISQRLSEDFRVSRLSNFQKLRCLPGLPQTYCAGREAYVDAGQQ